MIEWATMAEVARLFGWSESYARKLAHPATASPNRKESTWIDQL